MIQINKSPTADTRTCDFRSVDKETLLRSSRQHISDVRQGLRYFVSFINEADRWHDHDKISAIDQFHADFVTGFANHNWWDNHRKITRHHLLAEDGIPEDVNLIDVLEMIADCVMAGIARAGSVYPLNIDPAVLMRAFANTVKMLEEQVVVKDGGPA